MSSRTLSQDLRARIVAAVESGLFQHQVAEKFNVNPAIAVRRPSRGNHRPTQLPNLM